jgi:hypothetical protein
MFSDSDFDQDISKWDIRDNTEMTLIFSESKMNNVNIVRFILKNHNNRNITEIEEDVNRWQDYIVGIIKPEILCEYLREYEIDYDLIKGSAIEKLDCILDVYPELALADIFTL